jgi:hypothetical protein
VGLWQPADEACESVDAWLKQSLSRALQALLLPPATASESQLM